MGSNSIMMSQLLGATPKWIKLNEIGEFITSRTWNVGEQCWYAVGATVRWYECIRFVNNPTQITQQPGSGNTQYWTIKSIIRGTYLNNDQLANTQFFATEIILFDYNNATTVGTLYQTMEDIINYPVIP